jgi:uncharacterized protein
VSELVVTHVRSRRLDEAAEAACQRIAPTWPLDRFIAVNTYWGYVHQPIERAAAELGAVSGTRGLMPRAFYRDAWQKGDVQRAHLLEAVAEEGSRDSPEQLIAALELTDPLPERLPLFSDCVDARRDLSHAMSWRDVITHQVSQFCAARFDADQAHWHPEPEPGLYASWRARMLDDHGGSLLTGERRLAGRALRLPASPDAMLAHGVAQLGVPEHATADYLTALLSSINGWAAWCAYRRWEARLAGSDDRQIEDLLAIRLAWECLLDDGERGPLSAHAAWARAWQHAPTVIDSRQERARVDWIWQRAVELAHQRPLSAALARGGASNPARPSVQAVFCIDVRSEVLRRALETVAPRVQTLGFAGFFGLPLAYTPLGTSAIRPQLPGLIAPTLRVTDACDDPSVEASLVQARQEYHRHHERWHELESKPASIFTFVESCGLFYLPAVMGKSLRSLGAAGSVDHAGVPRALSSSLRPRVSEPAAGDIDSRVGLTERVLRGMSLTQGFARIVLLVGHGSQSANNAHAAGLDCGACGGQTGEVNARVLAGLLNETGVREGLRQRQITVPQDTHFLAALHNTTTDEVRLCDADLVPASHIADVNALRLALEEAGHRARVERAPKLGIIASDKAERLLGRYQARANDWAQVRPEWGLAGNASLIVAPRTRTRGVHLAGRAFLHDYDCRADVDGSVLAQIMTAPMVVANWINMQYFASVVDNDHFGSGNKLLHNVVGGRIGVFEGNGGDLRIGLPMQSLHDGESWMHTPLRLSVFIEAQRAAIDAVISQHPLVRSLVEHRWLYLFRMEPGTDSLEAFTRGSWLAWTESPRGQPPDSVDGC